MTTAPKSHMEALKARGFEAAQFTGVNVDPKALTFYGPDDDLYDPRSKDPADPELMDAIRAYGGIHTPVLVRKDGDRYMVVCGHHRVAAALALNAEAGTSRYMVPCKVVKGSDIEVVELRLSENLDRKAELPSTLAYKLLWLQRAGRSPEQLAERFHMAPARVAALLTFHDLDPKVQAAIDRGEVGLGTINEFASVDRATQREALVTAKEAGATNNHHVKAAIKAAAKGEAESFEKPLKVRVVARSRLTKIVDRVEAIEPEDDADKSELKLAVALLQAVLGDPKALSKCDKRIAELFIAKRTNARPRKRA